jgi:hypothetical protein
MLENDALAILELRQALAKAPPFRGVFHGHFSALEFNTDSDGRELYRKRRIEVQAGHGAPARARFGRTW